jgi:DNA polymerase-3 subunit alpha
VITDAVALVQASRGLTLDADQLPLDDARTYQLLSEARTLGVFQLESQGMRDALQKLRPERIEDIIAMVALYRPGPMDLIPEFVNRKHGRSEIAYEHPAMERHLQETYGIMVYQEQVMRLAADLAGFTLGQADTLRKAMGKKDRELMAQQREQFVTGCKANKVEGRKAERIWDLIEKFAGYGFNKSHAACYGVVAYQTAYLKANYPVEFMAALLTSEMDRTDKIVQYMEESRAMGLAIALRTSIARARASRWRGTSCASGWPPSRTWANRPSTPSCGSGRRQGVFASLTDFCARVDLRLLNRRVLESLIKAGACDGFAAVARACWARSTRPWKPGSAASVTARKASPRSSTPWAARRPRRTPRRPRGRRLPPCPSGPPSSSSPTRRKCWASTSPGIRSNATRSGRASSAPPPPPTWPRGRWERGWRCSAS